ncbi:MAG: hypothetical protein Q4P18_01160 [Methanobrevibacter sp.]|nr:hypothetical protein [Methanobrevibacter sp.]
MPNFIARKGPFCESLNQDIAGSLRTLKKLRQQSDYDLKIPKKGNNAYNHWNFTNVNDAFDLANKIFDSFESLK